MEEYGKRALDALDALDYVIDFDPTGREDVRM